MPSDLILGRPVRGERTHQIKNPKPGSDSIGKAAADLDPVEWKVLRVGRRAGAEIVDRDAYAEALDPAQDDAGRRPYAPMTESAGWLAAQGALSPQSSRECRAMPRLTSQACSAAADLM
jgi:hypothetical protein